VLFLKSRKMAEGIKVLVKVLVGAVLIGTGRVLLEDSLSKIL